MDQRQEQLLNAIIREHIATGMPVGSGILVEKYRLDISPATARNEMADLEEEGYIIQPHTSAGRIPTEKAYRFYIDNLSPGRLGRSEKLNLERQLVKSGEDNFKEAAKELSNISGAAIFWAFHRHNLYYTGISNLFQQPEFSRLNVIHDISAIIDRIDEIVNGIFNDIREGVDIRIGRECPFGSFSGVIMAKYKSNEHQGLFGILGPMRMDYEKNIALVQFVLDALK